MFTLTWTKNKLKTDEQPAPFLFVPQGDRFTFGRSADCDRQIQAEGLSRLHCTIVRTGEVWSIVDGDGTTGSRYGIFYPNGERLFSTEMIPGKAIYLVNSGEDTVILKRDRIASLVKVDDRDLTVNHELSTRVLIESLTDQTQQIEAVMRCDREHRDEQVAQFVGLLNAVCDEVKMLKTEFGISTVDDSTRDKKMSDLRTLTRLLAVVVGGAGLWLLVKDQQTASNIFGIVIMIGGAVGFGRSGQK
jgi:FHA domain